MSEYSQLTTECSEVEGFKDKALEKKTFGIKNEDWIIYCALILFFFSVCLALVLLMGVYIFYCLGQQASEKFDWYCSVLAWYALGSIYSSFFIFCFLVCILKTMEPKKAVWVWGSVTIFNTFYLYNPWIFECQINAKPAFGGLEFSLTTMIIFGPVALLTESFITFIFWRMSKVKPDYDGDEPYEVIYGGEGSSTKMNSDENSE